MEQTKIQSLIGQLSESLVLSELDDMAELAALHEQFEQIGKLVESIDPQLTDVAKAAGHLIQDIILRENDDLESALAVLTQTVDSLQGVINEGIDFASISFPSELNLSSGSVNSDHSAEEEITSEPQDEVLTETPEVQEEQHDESDLETDVEIDETPSLDDQIEAGHDTPAASEPGTEESKPEETPVIGDLDTGNPEEPGPDVSSSGQANSIELPDNVDEDIFTEFLSAQPTVLDELESLALSIEQNDEAALASFRRILHTLKGESGLVGVGDAADLCHAMEDALDANSPASLVDQLLESVDWLRRRFASYSGDADVPEDVQGVIDQLSQPSGAVNEDSSLSSPDVPDDSDPSSPSDVADQSDPSDLSTQSEVPDQAHLSESPGQSDQSDSSEKSELPDPANQSVTPEVESETGPESEFEEDVLESSSVKVEPLAGDIEMISEFIFESLEHLDDTDRLLLTIEADAGDADSINGVFRAFHTIKGLAGFLYLNQIQSLAHSAESLLDRARKGELLLTGASLDLIFESSDLMRQLIELVREAVENESGLHHINIDDTINRINLALDADPIADDVPDATSEPSSAEPKQVSEQPVGEILVDSGAATPDMVDAALEVQRVTGDDSPRIGEVLVDTFKVPPKEVSQALREQRGDSTEAPVKNRKSGGGGRRTQGSGNAPESDSQKSKQPVKVRETVKVDADRLDAFIDTIGELVIAEAMVSQSDEWGENGGGKLPRLLTHLDKITRELQEMAMSLRMVPIKSTFHRMARLARDVAKKLGKKINFKTFGEDTELDKTVVDAISDPLVHMVRNAVDHGIEGDSTLRTNSGKPEAGNVEIRAFHQGGSIYVEIEDDGRGMDTQVILEKAIEKGLVREGDSLTDQQILKLTLEPGFSTAGSITDVSGRGVGMDVVRRNIEAMRGKIEIRSEKGKGTIFSIRLPLTLAIIEGMVLRVGTRRYIMPTLSIVRMIRPEERQITTVMNRGRMIKIGDELIPLHRLDQVFDTPGLETDPTQAAVVVVEDNNRNYAFIIDELLGQQQTVIKPLGEALRGTPGLAGGAIMPDGRVGLILDVAGLVNLANLESPRPAIQTQIEDGAGMNILG